MSAHKWRCARRHFSSRSRDRTDKYAGGGTHDDWPSASKARGGFLRCGGRHRPLTSLVGQIWNGLERRFLAGGWALSQMTVNIQDVYSLYTARMGNHERRIGVEAEYPIIRSDGFVSAERPDIETVFEDLVAAGWARTVDRETGSTTGVVQRNPGHVGITTDLGIGILEVNLPPRTNLHVVSRDICETVTAISRVLATRNLFLLGYGIQPVSRPSRRFVAAKSRYRALENRFSTRKHARGLDRGSTDFHYLTATAAIHAHIDVQSGCEAVAAVNAFNLASPVMMALMGNSPVWHDGTSGNHRDFRQLFWDWAISLPRDEFRKGIPPKRFTSIKEYVDQQLGFDAISTMRESDGHVEYFEIAGTLPLRSWLERGSIDIARKRSSDARVHGDGDMCGEEILEQLDTDMMDVFAQDACTWYEARLKAQYGALELRCCSEQRLEDQITVPALALGLMENLEQLVEWVSDMKPRDARRARTSCIKSGLQGWYGRGRAYEAAELLVDIAEEGLRRRLLGEEVYLEPLARRVRDRENPADVVMAEYGKAGIEGLVRLTAI